MVNERYEERPEVDAVLDDEDGFDEPPLYEVIMLNDNFTPMEFVVVVLEQVFAMDRLNAMRTMLEVHTAGRARCGQFSYEIAEAKVSKVHELARQQGHPLTCSVEPI